MDFQEQLNPSVISHHVSARNVTPLQLDAALSAGYQELQRIGINLSPAEMQLMAQRYVGDAELDVKAIFAGDANVPPPISTPNIANLVQFMQAWLPGFVGLLTQIRVIDELVGMTTIGEWPDAEIVQQTLDISGSPRPYTDESNIPLANLNSEFVRRKVIHWELGMQVGIMSSARTSRMNIDEAAQKRNGVTRGLDILRNDVGFNGYETGSGTLCYGFLNDPNLPAYVNVTTPWDSASWVQVINDIRLFVNALRTQSSGVIDPLKMNTTLAVALGSIEAMSITNDFGITVAAWMKEIYPLMRVVAVPQLDAVSSGKNAAYLYAENVEDGFSTDGGSTWLQLVPTRLRTLGVEQRIKSFLEDYGSALAGLMLKRPYAVYRAGNLST